MTVNTGVYRATALGVDVEGPYAVVCETHGTMAGARSLTSANAIAGRPEDFCDACRDEGSLDNHYGKR